MEFHIAIYFSCTANRFVNKKPTLYGLVCRTAGTHSSCYTYSYIIFRQIHTMISVILLLPPISCSLYPVSKVKSVTRQAAVW